MLRISFADARRCSECSRSRRWSPLRRLACAGARSACSSQVKLRRRRHPSDPAPLHPPAAAEPRSPRNANYSIDVELDPASRTVTGRSVVSWRNISARPTSELQFHLYWNAWRNTDSTWMRERLRAGRGPAGRDDDSPGDRPADDWSYIDITAIRLLAGGARPADRPHRRGTFIAPDDGNRDDRTVLSVPLPRAVAPGRVGHRGTGVDRARAAHVRAHRRGRQLLLHRAVVPEARRARRHRLEHASVPRRHRVLCRLRRLRRPHHRAARLGRRRHRARARAARTRPRARPTHRYVQEDVHDFVWTTSPDYVEQDGDLRAPAAAAVPTCGCCCSPSTSAQAERHFAATRATLQVLRRVVRPVSVRPHHDRRSRPGRAAPAAWSTRRCSRPARSWLAPAHVGDPEGVTIHEAGHQFWYGLVGNNEFEHAWLDEGLNQFSTARAMHEALAPIHFDQRFFGGFIPWVFREAPLTRIDSDGSSGYRRRLPKATCRATPSWRYFTGTGGAITYNKTALWLHTLERAHRLASAAARPVAVLRAIAIHASEARGSLCRAVGRSRARPVVVLRSGLSLVEHVRLRGEPAHHDRVERARLVGDGAARRFADGVEVAGHVAIRGRRAAAGRGGVSRRVLVRFADGSTARERWDGRDRWKLFMYDRPAAAVSAEVDPNHVLLLDVNRTNNSRARRVAAPKASRQWAGRWWLWLQDLAIRMASSSEPSAGPSSLEVAPRRRRLPPALLGFWLLMLLASTARRDDAWPRPSRTTSATASTASTVASRRRPALVGGVPRARPERGAPFAPRRSSAARRRSRHLSRFARRQRAALECSSRRRSGLLVWLFLSGRPARPLCAPPAHGRARVLRRLRRVLLPLPAARAPRRDWPTAAGRAGALVALRRRVSVADAGDQRRTHGVCLACCPLSGLARPASAGQPDRRLRQGSRRRRRPPQHDWGACRRMAVRPSPLGRGVAVSLPTRSPLRRARGVCPDRARRARRRLAPARRARDRPDVYPQSHRDDARVHRDLHGAA